MKIKKGKILKIKLGYNPNCSAAMGRFDPLFFSVAVIAINVITATTISIILYKRRLSEISKNNKNKDIKSKDIKNEDKI